MLTGLATVREVVPYNLQFTVCVIVYDEPLDPLVDL
jgi:hypothetical protein